jgi:Fic family protein
MVFETPTIEAEELAALARIDELKRELRFRVAEPRRGVGSVRRVQSARAIRGSNSIEGFDVSVEDALAAIGGDAPAEARERDWLAVTGYQRAMTYVLQLAHDPHFEYTATLLRSLHFMMTEYALDAGPGLWRPGPIWVRNDLTGEIVYEAPESGLVPGLMEDLVAQLEAPGDCPPLIRGAMAHLNLTMIHPFRDGNGRMARCLQTLVLARDKILSPEWMSIEEYLGDHTQDYYDILSRVGQGVWSPERDAREWVRFCLQAHYVQAKSVLRRVRESERIWVAIDELRESKGLPPRVVSSLFDAATGLRVRNASHRRSVEQAELEEISHQVATNDLVAMVRAGLLSRHGSKRSAYYEAAGLLVEAGDNIYTDRQPVEADSLFDVRE